MTLVTAHTKSRENAYDKPSRLLIEARVTVKALHNGRAYIMVKGDSGTSRTVVFKAGRWRCSCPARPGTCAHVLAAMSITDIGAET